ncbi:MAG: hypothetical protein ABSB31_07160 [Dehalococcoidia bacterium]|jgi:hypothetical protein
MQQWYNCQQCGQLVQYGQSNCLSCGTQLTWPAQQVPPAVTVHEASPGISWTERCPVCQAGKLYETAHKKLLGLYTQTNLICNNCGAAFVPDGQSFKLINIANKLLPIWLDYANHSLRPDEWKRISYGGISDEKQHDRDLEGWMTALKDGNVTLRIEGGNSSIILKENEDIRLILPSISLWEPRSVRNSSGVYGGPSFRIAKGVYWRVGAFQAQSQSHDELKELDRGTITLTNRRLVFSGQIRNSEINLIKIISIEPYSDGIAVRTSGKSKPQYFVGLDLKRISTIVTYNGRSYQEPFTGLMMKYIIEGIIKRPNVAGESK